MKIGVDITGAEAVGSRRMSRKMDRRADGMAFAQVMEDSNAAWTANESRFRTGADKVPYGYLARDGVICYNGVNFVCDEKTNSICLGDMADKKNVITIALSGGGHLKVNRDNLGELSKAAGMFSPEDLNLIMRAIAQDTKIQSMQKEIDDMKAAVGSRTDDRPTEETDGEE